MHCIADIFIPFSHILSQAIERINTTFNQVVDLLTHYFYSRGVGIPALQATVIPPTNSASVTEHRIF